MKQINLSLVSNMFKFYLLLLIHFLCNYSQAQDIKSDLALEIRQINNTGVKVRPESSIPVLNKKLDLARANNDERAIFEAFNALFLANSILRRTEEEKIFLDSMINYEAQNLVDGTEIDILKAKSRYYFDINDQDARLIVLEQYHTVAVESKDSVHIGRSLLLQGDAHILKGEFAIALPFYERAYILFSSLGSLKGLAQVASHMATYYGKTGDFEKAIREGKTALRLNIRLADTLSQINTLSNLSSAYLSSNNINKAVDVLNQKNELIDLTEFPQAKKHSINMGIAFIEKGAFREGLNEIREIEKFYQASKNKKRLALANHWMAIAYRGLNNYKKAAELSKKAYALSEEIQFRQLSEINAYTLFQTYHWRDNNKEAIKWLQTSQEIKEDIFSEKKRQEMLRLEAKYETARKENEIKLLKAEAEIDRIKKNTLWLAIMLLTITAISLFYAQYLRFKKRRQLQGQQLRITALENAKLQQQLEFKQKELTSQLLFVAQKNELLQRVVDQLDAIPQEGTAISKSILKIIRKLKSSITSQDSWDEFIGSFKEIHQSFNTYLTSQFSLTSSDLRLASLIKMNFNNKEIANLLNISAEGIKKARYRLRKKLALETTESLDEYILNIQ